MNQNKVSYSKGITWIDDCRIPYTKGDVDKINFDRPRVREHANPEWILKQAHDHTNPDYKEYNTDGRFPANILVCDDMLNDGVISKSVRGRNDLGSSTYGGNSLLNSKTKMNNTDRGFNDKGTNSRYYDIDKWFDKILND